MRKKIIAGVLLAALAIPTFANAAPRYWWNEIVFTLGQNYYVDQFDPEEKWSMDVPPQIIDGRTYLPVRYVVESMGIRDSKSIVWIPDTKKIMIYNYNQNQTIELTVGSKTLVYTDETGYHTKEMDVAPVIRNDRTMLPVRFVAEVLHYNVEWNGYNQTITLFSQIERKADIK